MTIRVLQVLTDQDRRGAQVFGVDLGAGLREAGFHVETVAMVSSQGAARTGVRALATRRLSAFRPLRREMRSADVVIAHGSFTLIGTAVAGLGLRTPVIYRQISELAFWSGSRRRRFRVRWYLSRMTHIVALWEGSKRALIGQYGVAPADVTVIPNSVRERAFRPPSPDEKAAARAAFGLPADRPVLLYVGALVAEKGVEAVIREAPEGMTVLLVGHGPDRGRLERMADARPGQVRFAGALDEVRGAYWASDLLVLPSRGGDSMPGVLIEAALSGIPTVATPVDGIVSMIDDGVTGVLTSSIEPNDLREAMQRAVERSEALGRAARKRALSMYTDAQTTPTWVDVVNASSASRDG